MIDVPEASFPILIPVHVATTGMTDELASIGGVPVAMKLQNLRRKWISLNRSYLVTAMVRSRVVWRLVKLETHLCPFK
jgi:protein KTI12